MTIPLYHDYLAVDRSLNQQRQDKAQLKRAYKDLHLTRKARGMQAKTREEMAAKAMLDQALLEHRERMRYEPQPTHTAASSLPACACVMV